MFKSKNINRRLFFLAVIVCGTVLGFVVKRVGSSKPEVGRADIVSDKAVMPSVAEASQKKGLHPTNGIVRLVSLAHDDARRGLQEVYTSQIGIREATGKNDGPEVEKYLLYTGLGRGNAWCAAFVSWTFQQAGLDRPKTAWSPALFPDKRVIWQRNQQRSVMPSAVEASQKKSGHVSETHSIPLRSTSRQAGTGNEDGNACRHVKVGDVFGIYFSELKRIAHCGFVDSWDGTWCTTVEGNTNDMGSVYPENNVDNPIRAGPGEGVYRKKRLIKTMYKVADWVSK